MALNKERKVLLGLLGSAGLILGIDYFVLSAPSGAHAGTAQPAPESETKPTPDTTTPATKSAAGLSPRAALQWNQKLEQAAGERAVAQDVDPFADPVVPEQPAPDEAGPISVDAFVRTHQLSLVLLSGEMSVAMVNGAPVRLGDEIEGYRLISVDSRSAVFQAGEQTATLVLPKKPGGGTP